MSKAQAHVAAVGAAGAGRGPARQRQISRFTVVVYEKKKKRIKTVVLYVSKRPLVLKVPAYCEIRGVVKKTWSIGNTKAYVMRVRAGEVAELIKAYAREDKARDDALYVVNHELGMSRTAVLYPPPIISLNSNATQPSKSLAAILTALLVLIIISYYSAPMRHAPFWLMSKPLLEERGMARKKGLHYELVELMKEVVRRRRHAVLTSCIPGKRTRLHEAIEMRDLNAVYKSLLPLGSVNVCDEVGRTPLHYAAMLCGDKSVEIVKMVLEPWRGTNVNVRDIYRRSIMRR